MDAAPSSGRDGHARRRERPIKEPKDGTWPLARVFAENETARSETVVARFTPG